MQKTRFVPTIPWKGNGGNESVQNAFLIPIGAALEEIPGICHLFEHLLIRRLSKYVEDVVGYTTEDYMIFICNELSPIGFVEQINRMVPTKEEILLEKMLIIEEIKSSNPIDSEVFFKKVWWDTGYANSPLGSLDGINKIDHKTLERFKKELLKNHIYCYDSCGEVTIINDDISNVHNSNPREFTFLGSTEITFKKNNYENLYFKGEIDRLYLVERILKIKNPGKLIQLSEKRIRCALVLDSKTNFPANEQETRGLMSVAVKGILKDIEDIKSVFNDRAINELESAFFYGERWENRVERLSKIQCHEILNLLNELNSHIGVHND